MALSAVLILRAAAGLRGCGPLGARAARTGGFTALSPSETPSLPPRPPRDHNRDLSRRRREGRDKETGNPPPVGSQGPTPRGHAPRRRRAGPDKGSGAALPPEAGEGSRASRPRVGVGGPVPRAPGRNKPQLPPRPGRAAFPSRPGGRATPRPRALEGVPVAH